MNKNIVSLGEFGLIEHITHNFTVQNPSTVHGPGDDAAVIDAGEKYLLVSTDLLLEGIHFDLTYTPFAHLGYKVVVVGISDIYAMNGCPQQVTVSVGLSAKLDLPQVEEFYRGVRMACEQYGVDLAGGDTSSSLTGFSISVTAVGKVGKDKITYRSGAQINDLICVTGNLGAAYMGLQLLEREKRALAGVADPKPRFEGYSYILQRQLKPEAQAGLIESLAENGIVPTAMIDISDGLASEMLHICKASGCGARIYLDKLPIAHETYAMAEELHADPVVAALNGGDDYEMLFIVPLAMREKLTNVSGIDLIGHITKEGTGAALVTPDGEEIALQAPGWKNEE
ncbi:MAG: thiamine-phosphate kinase [Rikenellaceae bacterium]|nr:thiamine-phosphate kinase [Rikenellaceae bacterium]